MREMGLMVEPTAGIRHDRWEGGELVMAFQMGVVWPEILV